MEYQVTLYNTFSELITEANRNFGCRLFMEDHIGKHSYRDFYQDILAAAAYLKDIHEQYIIIKFKEPYFFAVVYFAAVLTEHVACLLPKGHPIPENMDSCYIAEEMQMGEILAEKPLGAEELPVSDPEAPCTIAFSSGTSSKSKGCVLSQKNLLCDAQYSMKIFHYWEGERLLHILPYWHLFGLVADLIGPLHYGCSLFAPESEVQFFKSMKYFKPHCINMPPALADAVCQMLERTKDRSITGGSLKKVLCAGAPMNIRTAEKLRKFGILPCTAYGLTECSPCVAITPDNDVALGTAGKVISCVNVSIEEGEILVSGPTVMLGYYGDQELTDQKITEGRFHTGDTGYIDEKGHLVVLGRKDSMLIFQNGIKCVPESVEERINILEGVIESLLWADRSGIFSTPRLTVVTEDLFQAESCLKKEITRIMKQENLYPFILDFKSERLERNSMGKVVRRQ